MERERKPIPSSCFFPSAHTQICTWLLFSISSFFVGIGLYNKVYLSCIIRIVIHIRTYSSLMLSVWKVWRGWQSQPLSTIRFSLPSFFFQHQMISTGMAKCTHFRGVTCRTRAFHATCAPFVCITLRMSNGTSLVVANRPYWAFNRLTVASSIV